MKSAVHAPEAYVHPLRLETEIPLSISEPKKASSLNAGAQVWEALQNRAPAFLEEPPPLTLSKTVTAIGAKLSSSTGPLLPLEILNMRKSDLGNASAQAQQTAMTELKKHQEAFKATRKVHGVLMEVGAAQFTRLNAMRDRLAQLVTPKS